MISSVFVIIKIFAIITNLVDPKQKLQDTLLHNYIEAHRCVLPHDGVMVMASEVARTTPGRSIIMSSLWAGQVVHKHVPLSPSSMTATQVNSAWPSICG